MENVSIIGTGLMGYPMAQNILKAGFNLTAFNRTNKKAQGLSKNGAEVIYYDPTGPKSDFKRIKEYYANI